MLHLEQQVLETILESPGYSREDLRADFRLNDYRLNKVLRHIDRDLDKRVVVSSAENGVWIVDIDEARCLGIVWYGRENGGYGQCTRPPGFPDGRCYDHSEWENAELVAFVRYLQYLAGPAKPTAYGLLPLGLVRVEELMARLARVVAATRKDRLEKEAYQRMLRSAYATLRWRLRRRQASAGAEIPFEFWERHRRSSVNPFQYSLRKYFEILEVPVESSREEVLKAWKKLCRRYHPDIKGGDEELMKKINLAKDRIFRIRRWT